MAATTLRHTRPRRSRPFAVPVSRPRPMDREQLPYFWHPDRLTVESAPADFDAQLKAVHPGLACTKFPIEQCWMFWSRKPDITHPLCPGWLLLFLWKDEAGTPLPLDARVWFNLYRRDPRRYASALAYFDESQAELKRARERRAVEETDISHGRNREFQQFLKPKNIGHGSKSALHGDGSIVPSRGELNWLADRGGILGEKRGRRP